MSQSVPAERRRTERDAAVFVQGRILQGSEEDTGYVSDLSIEGMRMLTSRAPEEGLDLGVEIYIPHAEGPRHLITLEGRCIWRRRAELPGYFDCGFRFLSLNPENLEGLRDLIDAVRLPEA